MINTLSQLISNIQELELENQERNVERQNKLLNMWSEANDKMPPNIDANGRLHAPCRGYCLPTHTDYSTALNRGEDFIFDKGQYLPIPITEANIHKVRNSKIPYTRVASAKSEIDSFIEMIKDNLYINTKFNVGKSWTNDDNVEVCYLYTALLDSVSKEISNLVKEYFTKVMDSYKPVYEGVMIEGRRTVRGVVKNTGYSSWSNKSSVTVTDKMTVHLDDNTTCYGSVPKDKTVSVGDVVEFTATFSKSDTKHHGWFKRPSNLTILSKQ